VRRIGFEGRLPSLTKHRGERNGLPPNSFWRFPFWAWRTLAGCETIHIYPDLRLDYKLAALPIERRGN
jgi:hypothetical protein